MVAPVGSDRDSGIATTGLCEPFGTRGGDRTLTPHWAAGFEPAVSSISPLGQSRLARKRSRPSDEASKNLRFRRTIAFPLGYGSICGEAGWIRTNMYACRASSVGRDVVLPEGFEPSRPRWGLRSERSVYSWFHHGSGVCVGVEGAAGPSWPAEGFARPSEEVWSASICALKTNAFTIWPQPHKWWSWSDSNRQ